MAFNDGIDLSYQIEDIKGDITSFSIQFPSTADVVIMRDNFAPDTAVLLDEFIDGKINGATATINVNLDGVSIKDAPILGADVEEGAVFSFRSTAGAPTNFRIPTIDETYGLETGRAVDTSDPAIDAIIQRIVNGVTVGLTNVRFADSHGNNVSAFQKAVDGFRKTRR